jgi:NAD(P) transhydrogenase subunit alpha
VTIIGWTDLPSRMAAQASQLYGNNLCHLLDDLGRNQDYHVDLEDEVIRGTLLLYEGKRLEPLPPKLPSLPAASQPATAVSASSDSSELAPPTPAAKRDWTWLWAVALAGVLVAIGATAPPTFLEHFTVFVLACFVGWQVIWNVKPALHTPLMSVTNAISGIIILGGMLQISGPLSDSTTILGAIAILIGTINIAGGFLVTQRMLKMFQK